MNRFIIHLFACELQHDHVQKCKYLRKKTYFVHFHRQKKKRYEDKIIITKDTLTIMDLTLVGNFKMYLKCI